MWTCRLTHWCAQRWSLRTCTDYYNSWYKNIWVVFAASQLLQTIACLETRGPCANQDKTCPPMRMFSNSRLMLMKYKIKLFKVRVMFLLQQAARCKHFSPTHCVRRRFTSVSLTCGSRDTTLFRSSARLRYPSKKPVTVPWEVTTSSADCIIIKRLRNKLVLKLQIQSCRCPKFIYDLFEDTLSVAQTRMTAWLMYSELERM